LRMPCYRGRGAEEKTSYSESVFNRCSDDCVVFARGLALPGGKASAGS